MATKQRKPARLHWTANGTRAYIPTASRVLPDMFACIVSCNGRWQVFTPKFETTDLEFASYDEAVQAIEAMWALER